MVYLGIDMHRKSSHVVAVQQDGEQLLSRRVESSPDSLWHLFGEFDDQPIEVAFESTFGWGWLADLLADAGIPAHMAHPLATKAIASARVKNDAVDAHTLAQLLRGDLLPEAWIAPREGREVRRLTRMRTSLLRVNSRLKCQVHAVLAEHGITPEPSDLFGRQGRLLLERLRLPDLTQERLAANLRLIDAIASEVRLADRQLTQVFAHDDRVRRLLPIPGIGPLTAAVVVAEIWDINRFPSRRHLASWSGLTPREHSSADHIRRGHISKQGSRWVRWVLVEAAQQAPRDPRLREFFNRVQGGRSERRKIARVALAHRLLTLCFYALRHPQGCRDYPLSS